MAEFVIARYDEPLGWLSELEPAAVTVYNKGDSPCGGGGARFAEVRCPNVGREGEAYLRHILDRYESLPTVTVFAQADITDHLAAWTAFGTRWGGARFRTKGDFLRHLAAQAAAEGISEPTEVFPCDTSDHNWRLDWNRDHLGREGEWFMADSYRGGRRRAFVDWFEAHVAAPPAAGDFSVCSCGIFAVRRDRILARPRAYYEALRSEVGWHPDPAEGHFLERAWWYVFGGGAGAEACAEASAARTTEGDPK